MRFDQLALSVFGFATVFQWSSGEAMPIALGVGVLSTLALIGLSVVFIAVDK